MFAGMEVNLLGDPESSRFCGSSVPWACEEHSSSSALSEDEDFSDYASNYHQQGLLYDSSPHLLEYKKLRRSVQLKSHYSLIHLLIHLIIKSFDLTINTF